MESESNKPPPDDKGPNICFKLYPFGETTKEDVKSYSENMQTLDLVIGLCNYMLLIVMLGFIFVTLVRKNKLSKFAWKCLCTLIFITLLVGTAQIFFSAPNAQYCNFDTHIIYGIESILVFDLVCQVGYKIFLLCHSISEFLFAGILPSETAKRRNRNIGCGVFIGSIVLLAIFVILNSYWWFVQFNVTALRVWNFTFLIIQSLLFLLASIIYLASGYVLDKIY